MLPTRLTVWLFVAGLGPLLAAVGYAVVFDPGRAFSAILYLLVLGYDLALLLLLLADGWLARRTWKLRASREMPARLSVGVDNEIVLLLENRGRRRLRVIARDEPPAGFRADPELLDTTLAPHAWARLAYRLLPTERGDFPFGDIHLRCRGPLGLAWADRTVPARATAQVYPNLLELRRYEAMVRTTLVRTGGYHVRRLPGAGREFSHYREYTVDDDFRHIGWQATARRGKLITSVFESEQSQDIIFCLDVGRTMAARVGALTKLDHAINAVLMLTHVSQRFHDNLGLLVFSHSVHVYLPPSKGRAQYARFLQTLYAVRPELVYVNYR